jgi:hypothetical protein
MSEWHLIETAPRDGTVILVRCDDEGPFLMFWNASGENPYFQRGVGIWEAVGGHFTWSEERGFGPTHWKHVETRTALAEQEKM